MGDPLATLRDIHLPPASHSLSLMHWLIIFLLLIFFGMITISYLRRQQNFKRKALKTLDDLEKHYQTHADPIETAAQLCFLIKKTALMRYPRDQVASLHGQAWLSFLHTHAPHLNFNEIAMEITKLPYQTDDQPLTYTPNIPLLFKLTRAWIQHRSRRC